MSGKSPIQIYMVALDGDTPATAQALQRYLMTVLGKAQVTLSLVPTGAQVSSTLPDEIPTPGPAAGSAVCLVVLGSQWSQLAADTPGLMPWLTRQATREDVLFLFAQTSHQPSLPPALARSPALANKPTVLIDEGAGFTQSVKKLFEVMMGCVGAAARRQRVRQSRRILGMVGLVAVVATLIWQGPPLFEAGLASLRARDPAYPMELVQQGYEQFQHDQVDGAIALFEQAVAIEPNTFQAHEALALAYAKKGDDAKALLAWDQVIQSAPWYIDAYLARGWLHFKLKHDTAALADFTVVKATSKAEQTAQSFTGSGWIYFRQNDYTRAAAEFQRATELMPTSKDGYMGLGWSLLSLKKYEASALALEQWARLDPTAEAFLMLAKAHDAAGQFKAALVSYKRYAELEPTPDPEIVKRIKSLSYAK